MKRIKAIILCCSLALSGRAQVPFEWDAETSVALAASKEVYRGETVQLLPSWTNYGAAADTNGWTFTLYWQTNGMGSAWWTDTTNAFLWTPARDCGASQYRLFVCARAPGGGASYRANAVFRMIGSPGSDAARLPPPSEWPDLAAALAPLAAPLIQNGYATTQQLAAAQAERISGDAASLEALATNRVVWLQSPDGSRLQDATGGVWRVDRVIDSSRITDIANNLSADYGLDRVLWWEWRDDFEYPAGYWASYWDFFSEALVGRVYQDGASWNIWFGTGATFYGGSTPYGTFTNGASWVTFAPAYTAQSITSALPRVAYAGDLPPTNGLLYQPSADARYLQPPSTAGLIRAVNVLPVVVTNRWLSMTWRAAGTNAIYVQCWDASNGTWTVEEVLP